MLYSIRQEVKKLLENADHAHGIDHIDRVLELTLKFEMCLPVRDKKALQLIVFLHDVDDYKLFENVGQNGFNLPNAKRIMDQFDVPLPLQEKVLNGIREIGFSKRLKGISPTTLEAMLVSDADMCDAMSISGIVRGIQYAESKGWPFFEQNTMPRRELTYDLYMNYPPEVTMCYFFEKPLRMRSMMMTAPGIIEATARSYAMIKTLRYYFKENDLTRWDEYLTEYLETIGMPEERSE